MLFFLVLENYDLITNDGVSGIFNISRFKRTAFFE